MSAPARRAALVVSLAIAGLALAVALAVLTSHLTTQHVGLAGEPLRPATGLVAPASTSTTGRPPTSTPASTTGRSDDAGEQQGDD